VLFTLLFAQAKNKPSARTGPGIPVPPAAHLSKKVRYCTAAQKEPQRGGGFPGKLAGPARSGTVQRGFAAQPGSSGRGLSGQKIGRGGL
ncbi:hypothetical protein D1157_16795, partial [Anaerotruncus sp. X29]|nr:hypothetical protein [Anaerotruncus sp. X29]